MSLKTLPQKGVLHSLLILLLPALPLDTEMVSFILCLVSRHSGTHACACVFETVRVVCVLKPTDEGDTKAHYSNTWNPTQHFNDEHTQKSVCGIRMTPPSLTEKAVKIRCRTGRCVYTVCQGFAASVGKK